jgi:Rps23 Pro-64 3,4-dihydroxylase Tpa1-like proline 4-hydroxylase
MGVINYPLLNNKIEKLTSDFKKKRPFHYVVIDNFLNETYAKSLLKNFNNTSEWTHYCHYNEKKLALIDKKKYSNTTLEVFEALKSATFINFLQNLTKINNLLTDELEEEGANLTEVREGGFLNIHSDFQSHSTKKSWNRELNLLLYLNHNWKSEYNGDLEFWDENMMECKVTTVPIFNRCVIFKTEEKTFHGHPNPLTCPKDMSRKSLILYYFTDREKNIKAHPTDYRARPHDGLRKKVLINLDGGFVKSFTYLKRTKILSDMRAGKILKPIKKYLSIIKGK